MQVVNNTNVRLKKLIINQEELNLYLEIPCFKRAGSIDEYFVIPNVYLAEFSLNLEVTLKKDKILNYKLYEHHTSIIDESIITCKNVNINNIIEISVLKNWISIKYSN